MGGLVVALAASYLLGSLPTAYLAVKWLKHVDVRTVGSGNVGATNVTRVAGRAAGLAVFLIDVAKGLIAVRVLASWLIPSVTPEARFDCGVMAVVGHCFPLFLNFQGGKGVATTIGVLVGALPSLAAVCAAIWLACFARWRYVSVASIAAMAALPIAQVVMRRSPPELLFGIGLAFLVILRHRSNIERLRVGTEPRFKKGACPPAC